MRRFLVPFLLVSLGGSAMAQIGLPAPGPVVGGVVGTVDRAVDRTLDRAGNLDLAAPVRAVT